MDRPLYASQETVAAMDVLSARVERLERLVGDHEQRFDTLQTPWPRRAWFWLRWGWPWHDLNADRPRWRPWNRSRRAG